MSALSLAASPSLSFILTLTAPSLPELHRRQVRFFLPQVSSAALFPDARTTRAFSRHLGTSLLGLLKKRQRDDEEVCYYSVAGPRHSLQGEPHLGKRAQSASKEGYQEEAESSQTSQGHGQTQLSEGGWYSFTSPSCGSLLSASLLSECIVTWSTGFVYVWCRFCMLVCNELFFFSCCKVDDSEQYLDIPQHLNPLSAFSPSVIA